MQKAPLLTIINHFLRTVSVPYNDTEGKAIETDAVLSAASTLEVRPGVKAQHLHRDDFIWQWTHGKKVGSQEKEEGDKLKKEKGVPNESQNVDSEGRNGNDSGESEGQEQRYEVGQDINIGLLVPGIDTCVANGATLVREIKSLLSNPTIDFLFWREDKD